MLRDSCSRHIQTSKAQARVKEGKRGDAQVREPLSVIDQQGGEVNLLRRHPLSALDA